MLNLSDNVKQIDFVLAEAPKLATENLIKNIFLGLASAVIRSLRREEEIHQLLLKDLDGVQVSDKTVTVDLYKVPSVKKVLDAELLGVKIMDIIRVDNVEIQEGELLVLGGLRVSEKYAPKQNKNDPLAP